MHPVLRKPTVSEYFQRGKAVGDPLVTISKSLSRLIDRLYSLVVIVDDSNIVF